MGVVFRARDLRLNRIVALKLILTGRLASEAEVKRFRNEAEAAAQLEHTNILPIYEVGESQGRHFFAMKLVEGGSLSEAIQKLLLPFVGLLTASQAAKLVAAQKPVLMVIANRDFYYQEYGDTRRWLETSGLTVKVAAATTARSIPMAGTGQPAGVDGVVVADLTLAKARSQDYSAIVFVGGWGSSMYQYAYIDPNLDGTIDSYYAEGFYHGDDNLSDGKPGQAKAEVNRLINDFVAQDKYVCGLCHGVSVLAWARVDGVSPLQGKKWPLP